MALLVNYFPTTLSTRVQTNFYSPDKMDMHYKLRKHNLNVYSYYAHYGLSLASLGIGTIAAFQQGLIAGLPGLLFGLGIGYGTHIMAKIIHDSKNEIQQELKDEHLHIGGHPRQVRGLYFKGSSEFLNDREMRQKYQSLLARFPSSITDTNFD